jgi:hypothetical protein
METDPNELAARFLLGKLTAEEQEAVEKEYFQKTSSFEDILIAENALTDAYVSGRLTAEDRLLFENRLLINKRQHQRAAFAETFINYASRQPMEDLGPAASESKWSTIFARFFSVKPLLSYSFSAAVILLLAGVAFWWISTGSGRLSDKNLAKRNTPAEVEIRNPRADHGTDKPDPANEKDNNESSKDNTTTPKARQDQLSPRRLTAEPDRSRPIISTIILPLGSTRSADTAKAFVVPEKTNLVKLKLKFEDARFHSYFAVVETADGQQVSRGKVLKSSQNKNVSTVTLTVPAHRLKRGDYVVTLKGFTKEGIYESVADYSFTIDRR